VAGEPIGKSTRLLSPGAEPALITYVTGKHAAAGGNQVNVTVVPVTVAVKFRGSPQTACAAASPRYNINAHTTSAAMRISPPYAPMSSQCGRALRHREAPTFSCFKALELPPGQVGAGTEEQGEQRKQSGGDEHPNVTE
jgi:hypothetical protein